MPHSGAKVLSSSTANRAFTAREPFIHGSRRSVNDGKAMEGQHAFSSRPEFIISAYAFCRAVYADMC